MTIDEIGTMDGSMCILRIRGERPFFSEKFKIEKHKNYKLLSDYDPSRHLDVKKYLAKLRNTDISKRSMREEEFHHVPTSLLDMKEYSMLMKKYSRQ